MRERAFQGDSAEALMHVFYLLVIFMVTYCNLSHGSAYGLKREPATHMHYQKGRKQYRKATSKKVILSLNYIMTALCSI